MMDQAVINALSSAASEKQFGRMRELLDSQRKVHGDGPQYGYWEGVYAARQGRHNEALVLLEDAAHRAPRIPSPRYELGNVLASLNRLPEAAAAYESAIMLHQSFVGAWINLAAVRLRMNDLARAERAIASAMQLDPNRVETWITLAKIQQVKFPDRAIDTFQEARRRFGGHPGRDSELLNLLFGQNKREQAVQLLEQMLHENAADPVATHLLAALRNQPSERAADAYIRENFKSYAPHYDEHMLSALGYRSHQVIANALKKLLPAPARVLDLGCGTGLLAPELADYTLTGVDLSPEMLQQAASRDYEQLHCAELGTFLKNVEPSQYAAALAADTLIYYGDLHAIFAEIARALGAGGVFIASFESAEHDFALQLNGRYAHSKAHISKAAQAAGMQILSLESHSGRKEGNAEVAGWLLQATIA